MGRNRKNRQVLFENVELLASGGEGHAIARIDNKVIFVKYGAPGDIVDIQIIGRKKKFSIAKITKIHKSSDVRVEPFCEHYGVCGGCKWQHIDYESQLDLKHQWTQDCLSRIGKLQIDKVESIVQADKQQFYRNKMEYTFSNKRWLYEGEDTKELEHTNALGFHAPGRFDKIINIEKCWLQNDKGNDIRNFIYTYCIQNNYSFYDLREHSGLMRNVMLRNSVNGEWMVNVIFAEQDEKKIENLLSVVKEKFNPTALNYAINTKLNDSVFDLEFKPFSGSFTIKEQLHNLIFKISPKSFFQTNTKQAEKLYQVALDFADIQDSDVVYDLYCGTGTITCIAANQAKHAIGVEIIPEAIHAARENATLNSIENVHFEVGDMKDVFNSEFYSRHGVPDIVITDPPRSGMHPKVLDYLLEIECKKLVYVSCNPATQARDLAVLSDKYKMVKSRAVDMFPQTHHAENVMLMHLK